MTIMSHAYLILCHRPPRHLATWATMQPEQQFYIHYDKKSPIHELDFLQNHHNIHILNNRISIHWGGFSMILATLNLFQAALSNQNNQYFHLISGDCAPLQTPETMSAVFAQYPHHTLFLQCENVPRLRHRVRFNAPHADTRWQRHIIGKILTKIIHGLDYILPSDLMAWQGSQWFSATRPALQNLFNAALGEPSDYFAKKLVPDEHFFQYIVQQQPENYHLVRHHHRFIRMTGTQNHPDDLSLDDLWAAQREGAWFARKVSSQNLVRFLKYESAK